jgi:hypothetical protein
MWSVFQEYARCPIELLDGTSSPSGDPEAGFFRWESLLLFGRTSKELPEWARAKGANNGARDDNGLLALPFDPTAVSDNLRLERYIDNHLPGNGNSLSWKSAARRAYYAVRPLLPVAVRKHAQRWALRDWQQLQFPSWPVDVTVDRLMHALFRRLLDSTGLAEIPFIWFWPDGRSAAAIMTHDVETARGRNFCGDLMRMEAPLDIHSAFEVVPEERYEVPASYLDEIRSGGCEICIHGLNHDGRLFLTEAIFRERAPRINEYARRFGAVGFRSPVMYRRVDWFDGLAFNYDMSLPNVAHLDPQRGGCCTVMPYFIGNMVELPLTTTQDYQLLNVLCQPNMNLWKQQCEIILEHHGLITFIVHPDYAISDKARDLYRQLLDHMSWLRQERGVWVALPRDVDAWWRKRNEMRVERRGNAWAIVGGGAERARLAYAYSDGDGVSFRLGDSAQ